MSGKAISIPAVWFWIITAVVLVVLALNFGIMASLIANLPEGVFQRLANEIVQDLNSLLSIELIEPGSKSHPVVSKITIDINFFLLASKFALGFIAVVITGCFVAAKTGIIEIRNVNELLKHL